MKLGQKGKCLVTGFEGTITMIGSYMHGGDRITLQPPMGSDGKVPDSNDFDVAQIIITDEKQVIQCELAPQKLKHGQKVRCKLSGFEGKIYGHVYWLNGCLKYAVSPMVTKEQKIETNWFYGDQLEVIDEPKEKFEPVKTGGPRDTAKDSFCKRQGV